MVILFIWAVILLIIQYLAVILALWMGDFESKRRFLIDLIPFGWLYFCFKGLLAAIEETVNNFKDLE